MPQLSKIMIIHFLK